MNGTLAAAPFKPMGELNTTPLIDILLVLLVMLILTLPPLTDSLEWPLPNAAPAHDRHPDRIRNVLSITSGDAVLWNGERTNQRELEAMLGEMVTMKPEPELAIAPEAEASYSRSAQVLLLVKQSGATRVGFVGNERYRVLGTGGPRDPTRR